MNPSRLIDAFIASKRLENLPAHAFRGEATIPISDAIQAVRDTEARVRHHYALSGRALREVGDAVRAAYADVLGLREAA